MAKKQKGKRPVKFEPPEDEREARVMGAARRAFWLAKDRLHEARDPASSKAVWAATHEVGQTIAESVETWSVHQPPAGSRRVLPGRLQSPSPKPSDPCAA